MRMNTKVMIFLGLQNCFYNQTNSLNGFIWTFVIMKIICKIIQPQSVNFLIIRLTLYNKRFNPKVPNVSFQFCKLQLAFQGIFQNIHPMNLIIKNITSILFSLKLKYQGDLIIISQSTMASKKTQQKQQEKVIQDRTFGLKNKNKSKVVQKFIKGVEHTVKNNGLSAAYLESQQLEAKKMKKEEEKQLALLDALYKTVDHVKAAASLKEQDEQADPKSIVCPFFKQGLCQKGKKCKYSHDLTLDRNQQLDLYVDQRTQLIMNDQNQKQMNEWDQDKLMEVIKEKEKAYIKQKPTEIVCKFFLQAVEKSKYGWNWECPNGISCHYKHCLPVGYILRKNIPKQAKQDQDTIQKQIDEARQKIGSKGQLVTLQVFLKWKQEKKMRKAKQIQEKKKQDERKGKAQGKQHVLSGRALFQFDPTLFVDDEEAADQKLYNERSQQEQSDEQEKQFGQQKAEQTDIKEQQETQKKEEDN